MSDPLSDRIRAMRDAEYPTRADWDRAYYGTFPPPAPHWQRDEAMEAPGFPHWYADVQALWPGYAALPRFRWYNYFAAGWLPAEAVKDAKRNADTFPR